MSADPTPPASTWRRLYSFSARETVLGPLAESVKLTLFDRGRPLYDVTFEDFASQASTDLSPTAGWGLPQNAIQFTRRDGDPSQPVFVSLTLASTGIGRGFESVGTAAGTYVNRFEVRTRF